MSKRHYKTVADGDGPPRLVQVRESLDALKEQGLTNRRLAEELKDLQQNADEVSLALLWKMDMNRLVVLAKVQSDLFHAFSKMAERPDLTRAESQRLDEVRREMRTQLK